MVQLENVVERYNNIILSELKQAGITCWAAGGAIRDYFMGIPIKTDIDLFFPDKENADKCIAYFKEKQATCIWESDNGAKFAYGKKTYDVVKHYFASPQATIDAFDFTVAMFAVDTEKVYHGESSFIDLAKRQLMINNITYNPASSMSRAFRYYTKGFKMCQGEMRKLVEAIQNMPKPEPKEETENAEPQTSGDAMFNGLD